MAYEFMWMPTGTVGMARQSAVDLMEKCALSGKADRDWISSAVSRMRNSFAKTHEDWEKKRRQREERKRAERAGFGGDDDVDKVLAARPKGTHAPTPKKRAPAAPAKFGPPPP